MGAGKSGNEATGGGPQAPLVEGRGLKRVRSGPEGRAVAQGVLGLDAISRGTVGSEGIFMGKYTVPPGAHSDLHLHANCETAVYVLAGRGYAYAGEEMDEYLEAGPGDFVYIPADLAHVVGCPAGGEPLEYIVTRNAPEEIVVTLRAASELPVGPDGRVRDTRKRG
jgi:uncharacterized RmlC-like cupin family protein